MESINTDIGINIKKLISNLEEFGYIDEGLELQADEVVGNISKDGTLYYFKLGASIASSEKVISEIAQIRASKSGKSELFIVEVGDWNNLHFYIAEVIK